MNGEPAEPERELRIGEVAKLAGTTPRTIRYYEEIGLLPAAGDRQPGAHRTYAEADVERLTELLRLKDLLGLSLEELKELVEAEGARAELRREWHSGVEDPVRRRQILAQSLTYIARQLELVRRRREEIAKLEAELLQRRRRVQTLLRDLTTNPADAREGR
jgi:MerR family transcriptional regulator, repressor of the yfmOP operon